ncbi:uncharacterized protein YpiB (UPF0302 family) [Natronobacillus azotifigens]|uniref:IDEAL domain-containing protein n=1 Tax=Natronobacillus azotifigens TaxID=472978 RepID=A0A9J6R8K4_9BACI|nr:IDEAL domain-containing protein [Natronobacillus azotifigens]MCZ0701968.1 IDEAL domain-containing protein [Natronobacillus azotifigens]
MEKNRYKSIQVGDWVETESSKGQRILGFIEKDTEEENMLQLRVIMSDNDMLTGHSIQVNQSKLTMQESNSNYSVQELAQLIDLALLTNDKAWFDELTAQYIQIQNDSSTEEILNYTTAN